MKILLIIPFLFIAFWCNAQTQVTDSTAPLTFISVVKVDSVTKDELFLRARKWFSSAFKDSKSVLNIQDKEAGELSGKATMKYSSNVYWYSNVTGGWITFEITVNVKDGRYKYEFTNFIHSGTTPDNQHFARNFGLITNRNSPSNIEVPPLSGKKWSKNVWDDIKQSINIYITETIESLRQGMIKPSGTASKDW